VSALNCFLPASSIKLMGDNSEGKSILNHRFLYPNPLPEYRTTGDRFPMIICFPLKSNRKFAIGEPSSPDTVTPTTP